MINNYAFLRHFFVIDKAHLMKEKEITNNENAFPEESIENIE